MKTIILIRHAKSSWKYDVSDKQRPLKTRGLNDAHLVAKSFLSQHKLPIKIFSSPAKRAIKTCKIFIKLSELSEENMTIIDDLYDFSGENVIHFIKNLDNNIPSVLIFGHNHAFTSISNIFGSDYISNLPTSGLVKIEIDIDNWNSLKKGRTIQTIIPKELR